MRDERLAFSDERLAKQFYISRKGAIYSINEERLAKSEVVNYVISAWIVDLLSTHRLVLATIVVLSKSFCV